MAVWCHKVAVLTAMITRCKAGFFFALNINRNNTGGEYEPNEMATI
jgi:hypothetical protein